MMSVSVTLVTWHAQIVIIAVLTSDEVIFGELYSELVAIYQEKIYVYNNWILTVKAGIARAGRIVV
jgi:hypothetical protein